MASRHVAHLYWRRLHWNIRLLSEDRDSLDSAEVVGTLVLTQRLWRQSEITE